MTIQERCVNNMNNKQRKESGAGLVDYVIPTAIVGLAFGLGLYFLVSSGNLTGFFGASLNSEQGEPGTLNIPAYNSSETQSVINPGSLGGTPENPQMQCQGGVCTIDFGEYVLSGIPENFNDYVLSSGASGGTEKLASLFAQLAEQLELSGKNAEAEELKKLASIAYNMSLIHKDSENTINNCQTDSDCYFNKAVSTFSKPEGYDETYYSFTENLEAQSYYSGSMSLAYAKYVEMYEHPSAFQYNLDNNQLAFLFQDQLSSIMQNDNFSSSMKGVIETLSRDIGIIGQDLYTLYYSAEWPGNPMAMRDPLTGEEWPPVTYNTPLQDFQNYNAASINNLINQLTNPS